MIPLQLTIRGLYSYQKKQTIDFTKLTESRLFGIFGPVGSGKSSILEAITFALYGKTDRLNLSGDNRNYNMMNLKSDDLLIDFQFETGKHQKAYRAIVKGRRNSKRFDEVRTLDRTAYQKDGDQWLPVEVTVLESAIGLSYENFKRTIIIPQGQFQEFLQLGNKDRTKMMKELFNLEKFELYSKVASVESKNNEEIQNIKGQLHQLGEVEPERVAEYEEQMKIIKEEIDTYDKNLKENRILEAEWRQIKELSDKLIKVKNSLVQLKKQEPEFNQLEKAVVQYEKCMFSFKNLLGSLKESNKKIENKHKLLEDGSHKLKLHQEELIKDEALLSELKVKYENRELLKKRAAELDILLKTADLYKKIENESVRLKK